MDSNFDDWFLKEAPRKNTNILPIKKKNIHLVNILRDSLRNQLRINKANAAPFIYVSVDGPIVKLENTIWGTEFVFTLVSGKRIALTMYRDDSYRVIKKVCLLDDKGVGTPITFNGSSASFLINFLLDCLIQQGGIGLRKDVTI